MELRLGLLTGALILAAAAAPARANPDTPQAKAAFTDGVAKYQKGDWAGASEALARAYGLEADNDALFAWAQAERKQNHCAKAIELYNKLLATPSFPVRDAEVVRKLRVECMSTLDVDGSTNPLPPPPTNTAPPPPPPPPPPHHWYADPVGDALALTGIVGLGAGATFLVLGHSANHAKASAATYGDFVADEHRATRDGRIGIAATIGGAALLGGGIAWFLTHREDTHVTTEVDRNGAIVSVARRF